KDFIVTGGVNIWKSSNGGTTMQIMAHWTGSGAPYVHADVHTVEFLPGSGTTVFAGCDGGLFKTANTGTSWSDIGKSTTGTGLQIGQIYKLSVSQTNANLTMTGWQDNGCSLYNNGTGSAARVLGGDGMEVLIDYSNASIMYGEQYNGNIWKSTNGGGSFNTNVAGTGGTGVDEDGAWVTPYIIHPTTPSTLLVGKKQVYRSTNSGTSFSTITLSGSGSTSDIVAMAYAPSNPSYIYVAKTSELHVSTNGTSFTNITSLIPTGGISSICVDPANPQRIWYTVSGQISGYSPGIKVFYSGNAGQTWTNVSYNLPNIPVNTIVYQPGSNDGLYVGTDVGVYYKDNSMSNWIYYSNGLPNVVVDELEIQQSTGKLRAATYGRGLWETDLYTAPTSIPVVAFSSNKTSVCKNGNVDFYDNSTNFPSSWSWTFAGGTPSISALQFPSVTYSNPGTYQVQLVATNAAGADSLIQSSYITVLPAPSANAGPNQYICKGDTAFLSASGGVAYTWSAATFLNNSQIQSPFSTTTGTRTYTVTVADANGCTATDAITIYVTLPPATPFVSVIQPDSLSASNTNVLYQWYYNGSIIPGGTTRHIYAPLNGTYSVVVTDTAGCGFSATSANFNYVGIKKVSLQDNLSIFPNPSKGNFELSIFSETESNYVLKIYNGIGECLLNEMLVASSGNFKKPISLNLPAGSYILELNDVKTKQKAIRKLAVINP
ncbi:MAG: PKD domain-containing protein, partial [Bacteroidia bacterium]